MRPIHSRSALRWRMGIVLAAASCALLPASIVTADDDSPTGDPAIPPGQEQLVARMLGRGMGLSQGTPIGGGLEYTVIKATYHCLGGVVALELSQPRTPAMTSVQTGRFAITVQRGSQSPPPAFQDALVALIRSQQQNFE